MRKKKDYYEVLGICKGAEEEIVKKAYRSLALQWHPVKKTYFKYRIKIKIEKKRLVSDSKRLERRTLFCKIRIREPHSIVTVTTGKS